MAKKKFDWKDHKPRHPVQPVVMDQHGVIRFKRNAIVDFLAKDKLNDLARMDFSREDWEQLAQLIGYSVSGFGDLSYVAPDTIAVADAMCESPNLGEIEERMRYWQSIVVELQEGMRDPIAALYQIHPDDLKSNRE